MAYIREHSFIATLKSVHSDYQAPMDFSRITSNFFNTFSGPTTDYGSEEYKYLCLTNLPKQTQKFWFLYHQWEDGSTSYEIKVQHPMFPASERNFMSLIITARGYVVPYLYTTWAQGWRITWDNQCHCPPVTQRPGKILYEVEPGELKTGELGTIRLNSPEGRDLQVYNRTHFQDDWWAYVTDRGGITLPLSLNILELGIKHPLE